MLRIAPLLRRGALLIRRRKKGEGPIFVTVPALPRSVKTLHRVRDKSGDYFTCARAMASRISLCASSAPPQRNTLTHLPGSRSL